MTPHQLQLLLNYINARFAEERAHDSSDGGLLESAQSMEALDALKASVDNDEPSFFPAMKTIKSQGVK
jgi:hypothetical protein